MDLPDSVRATDVVISERKVPKGRRVVEIAAYFRGDRPGGLGFIIQPPTDHRERLLSVVDSMIDAYDDAPADPRDLIEQLETLGALGIEALNDDETVLIALVNIWWLELRGHLETDEHNGVVWVTERGGVDHGS